MSLWTPPQQFLASQSNMGAPATPWTTVTASATPHTKGTPSEIFASLNFDVYWIEVFMHDTHIVSTDTGTLVDIMIGAISSEVVIIPNLNAGHAQGGTVVLQFGQKYAFPLFIPSGSRLSARSQAVQVSDTVHVSVRAFGKPEGPVWAGTKVTDYGTSTAASEGTTVVAGVSSAEGAWTQIVASTTQSHSYLTAGLAGLNTVLQTTDGVLDIGVGAAAAEVAISEDNHFNFSGNDWLGQNSAVQIWRPIPSGSRLAARFSQAHATAKSYDVVIYGVS